MSDTPITDAAVGRELLPKDPVPAELARKIERRLNEALAEIERLRGVTSETAPSEITAFLEEWHNVAHGKFSVAIRTQKRTVALRARLKDHYFRANWRAALQKVAESSFCKGANERGWVANVDWFLRPDSVVKIMEGIYDDRKNCGKIDKGSATERSASHVQPHHTAQQTAELLRRRQAARYGMAAQTPGA